MIYAHIFFHLRGRIKTIAGNDTARLSRATKFMLLYPLIYIMLTLPLAIGRMVAMTGRTLPDAYFCAAGTLLTSCGWMDALLYTLTRRVLVSNELRSRSNPRAPTIRTTNHRTEDQYGLQSMNGVAVDKMASHSVTITGGAGRRLSRIVENHRRARSHGRKSTGSRSSSPTGSTDSIIKFGPGGIGIVKETNIQFEPARESGSESDLGAPSDSRHHSQQNGFAP